MKLSRFVVGAVFLMAALAASAAVQTAAFRVDGMDSEDDVRRVTASLKRTPGVSDAVGDAKSQVVMVRYEDTKVRAKDLAEAVDIAGFTLSPLDAQGGAKNPEQARIAKVLGDFNSALGQTRGALDKDRFGLARNLALAMRVRRDAVVALAKAPAPKVAKGKHAKPAPMGPNEALTLDLSKAVDAFTAATEAREKVRAKELFTPVKRAFRKVVEAYNLDEMIVITPPQPRDEKSTKQAPQPEKSLQDQMRELSTKYL